METMILQILALGALIYNALVCFLAGGYAHPMGG